MSLHWINTRLIPTAVIIHDFVKPNQVVSHMQYPLRISPNFRKAVVVIAIIKLLVESLRLEINCYQLSPKLLVSSAVYYIRPTCC